MRRQGALQRCRLCCAGACPAGQPGPSPQRGKGWKPKFISKFARTVSSSGVVLVRISPFGMQMQMQVGGPVDGGRGVGPDTKPQDGGAAELCV